MIEFSYLYKGLCGMARAHQANSMAGHLGAAVTTGYFLGETLTDLDEQVCQFVQHDLDKIMEGKEGIWFDAEKAGIGVQELFEPLPEEESDRNLIARIPQALKANIQQLRQSGHNVIFASIATRALVGHPSYATPRIVDGIERLIRSFDNAAPGRANFGQERGWVDGDELTIAAGAELPPYRDLESMAAAVVDELIASAARRRQGLGGLFHIINHATGLIELARLGHSDLAQQGLAAHHRHLSLWRSLPDLTQELGPLKAAAYDPREPAYWTAQTSSQWSAHLTHRIKTLFGFHTLLKLVQDASTRKRAEEKFLYLMA